MKLRITNGRSGFKQWDANQRLLCYGVTTGTQIHFALNSERALVVEAYEADGQIVADVPNILLQYAAPIRAYVYVQEDPERYTKYDVTFPVQARPKPDDYIYEETEVLSIEAAVNEVAAGLSLTRAGGGFASVVANDTEENETNVAYSLVAGKSNKHVLKGFRITGLDERGGVLLHSIDGLWEGDNVVYYKKTESGVEKYRDRIVSIGGVCKQCMKDSNIGSKYPTAYATPTIDGNDNDAAWSKAPFVKEPTITASNIFDKASLQFTYDTNGYIYFRLYVKLKGSVNHNNIEVTIRPPYANDIKARFFGDDTGIHLEEAGSTITKADYNGETYITRKTTDFREFFFEFKVPVKAALPFWGGADLLVNVGCYFTRSGTSNTAGFNWGGIGVNWSPDIRWDMSKAINGWLLGMCTHGELVMFEDEIKHGILDGSITLVTDDDTHYASGAYLIALKTDAAWEDIGTAAYRHRQMLGDTELTFKEGDPVAGLTAGLYNLTGLNGANFGYMNDALGTDCFDAGRYHRNFAERGALFGYKNTLRGHEGFVTGVKNSADAYAGFIGGGESNEVNGRWGHGSGFDTKVTEKAEAGRAAGKGTVANAEAQDVSGTYNIVDEVGEYLEIVGNGTCDENYVAHRSNARTLDRNGNMWIAGELTFGPEKKTIEDIVRAVIAQMNGN